MIAKSQKKYEERQFTHKIQAMARFSMLASEVIKRYERSLCPQEFSMEGIVVPANRPCIAISKESWWLDIREKTVQRGH